jgi:hypothetical protein
MSLSGRECKGDSIYPRYSGGAYDGRSMRRRIAIVDVQAGQVLPQLRATPRTVIAHVGFAISRLISARILLVAGTASFAAWSTACAQAPTEPPTREWVLENVLPRVKADFVVVWLEGFRAYASIPQPNGEARFDQVLFCGGGSLIVGHAENAERYAADDSMCEAARDAVSRVRH